LREDDGKVMDTHDGTTGGLGTSIVDLFVEVINVGHGETPDQTGPLGRSRRRVPNDGSRSGTSMSGSTGKAARRSMRTFRSTSLRLLSALFASVVYFFQILHDDAIMR
jgi:hypothetical protein